MKDDYPQMKKKLHIICLLMSLLFLSFSSYAKNKPIKKIVKSQKLINSKNLENSHQNKSIENPTSPISSNTEVSPSTQNATLENQKLKSEQEIKMDSEHQDLSDDILKPLNEDHGFRFYADLSHYRYVEPSYISHTGLLLGLAMDWDYLNKFYKGELASQLQAGRLDYDGSICDIKTEQCSELKAKTQLVIFKVAHHFKYEFKPEAFIYLGLGYKYLYDKGEGLGFYGRLGQYIYVPIGIQFQLPQWGTFQKLGVSVEYAPTLLGGIDTFMSDVNSSYSNLRFDQNKAKAYKLILSYQPKKKFFHFSNDWILQVYFEKWDIEQSNKDELLVSKVRSGKYFIEPANYSENTGLRIGIHY